MSKALALDESNFATNIAQGVTLVDFWAPWCGPCQVQGPIVDDVSARAPQGVKIAKLNVDEAGGVAGQYGVMSIPTLIIFKDGEEAQRFVGVQAADVLIDALKKA
jgi:thioredoxin 1